MTQQTFTLNCNGAAGDMIYITDLDPSGAVKHDILVGHSISEVTVNEAGIFTTNYFMDICFHSPTVINLRQSR